MSIINSVQSMIDNIVIVVFRKHFYYITDKELEADLKQEGYLKAYELLAEGNYDPTRNLRTFIYTGVRNAMTNYLYHHRKENHNSSTEDIESQEWQSWKNILTDSYWEGKAYVENDSYMQQYQVDVNIIYEVCEKYSMFGDYIPVILSDMKDLGLYDGEIPNITITIVPEIENFIKGEVLYKLFAKQ